MNNQSPIDGQGSSEIAVGALVSLQPRTEMFLHPRYQNRIGEVTEVLRPDLIRVRLENVILNSGRVTLNRLVWFKHIKVNVLPGAA